MIRYKQDARGRDTNIIAGKRHREALGLPKGVGWCIPIPLELMESPAWRLRSERARKVVDSVMAELARHGGTENGNLVVTYSDITKLTGLRRNSILDGITEAVALGLLVITEHGRRSFGANLHPSRYRLTWLGTPNGMKATNEWRAIKEDADAAVRVENALSRIGRHREPSPKPSKLRAVA